MRFILKFFAKIYYKFVLKNFKPEIIAYKDSKGNKVFNSRISMLTHISNKRNIKIEKNVFIGHFNYLDGFNQLTIKEGCQITNYVTIVTHSSHDAIRVLGEDYIKNIHLGNVDDIDSGPVVIGKYTYIGPHVVIMPGTTIGKGCIISAFSYVKGNIPDYSIVRGTPAQIIGSTKDRDNKLLEKNPEFLKTYYDN